VRACDSSMLSNWYVSPGSPNGMASLGVRSDGLLSAQYTRPATESLSVGSISTVPWNEGLLAQRVRQSSSDAAPQC
jgi:hypothetical protein